MGLIVEHCRVGEKEDLFHPSLVQPLRYTLSVVPVPLSFESCTASPLDATDKLALHFHWCLAVIFAGTDRIGHEISALLHVQPGDGPQSFVRQLCVERIYALQRTARRETIVAGYAAGSSPHNPADDPVRASVYGKLINEVRSYIPFTIPFVELSSPKREDPINATTDVYYRTQERRVVIRQ